MPILEKLIRMVFGSSCPSKVGGINAAAIPATMGSVELIVLGLTMGERANIPMGGKRLMTDSQNSITIRAERVRPLYAAFRDCFRCLNGKDNFPAFDLLIWHRIAMMIPTLIMNGAPASRFHKPTAPWDRALLHNATFLECLYRQCRIVLTA